MSQKITEDRLQEYLGAINRGLKPRPIAEIPDTGMGDFKMQERTNTQLPVPSPVGAPVSMGDFRRIDAETREPIPGVDFDVPANPNAFDNQFKTMERGATPEMADGTENEWWNFRPTSKGQIIAPSVTVPFTRGAVGVMSGGGGAVRLIGDTFGVDALSQTGKNAVEYFDDVSAALPVTNGEKLLAARPFEWKDTLTPDFWMDGRAVASFMSAAGSSAPFAVGSILAAALAPAALAGATSATIAGLGRAALSTSAGRATIGKLMTNPAMQKLAANTFGKIGTFGQAYTAARVASSAPEALTEGGSSYNEIVKWNDAVTVLRDPQAGEGNKIEAKRLLQEMYEQAGGKGPIDPDHVPMIDDAKLRAWKQTGANLPILAASNLMEGANLFTPSKGALKGVARKAAFGALQNGPFEEYLQAGAETGIGGVGKNQTPIQGEDFVWSLNPAEWNPSTKNQVFGGALFGGLMGAAGGPVNVDPKEAKTGIVNQAVGKLFAPAQPAEAAPVAQAEVTPRPEIVPEQIPAPAPEPAPIKLKIGDTVPDDEHGPITLQSVSPEGNAVFADQKGRPVNIDVPIDQFDPSVFGKPAEQAGTVTFWPENAGLVANPDAKASKPNEIKPSESFYVNPGANTESGTAAVPSSEILPAETAIVPAKNQENIPSATSVSEIPAEAVTAEPSFAAGDKVNSSKGAGTIAKVTKSGVAIKTADGKTVSVSFSSMKKGAWVRKEEAAPVVTPEDAAETTPTLPQSSATSKPEYVVSTPAKIKVGDKVTRPGKNDNFEVVDASDASMFTLKNLNDPKSKPFKTGKKGVALVGSPEASVVSEPSPNEKQKLAWQKANTALENARELTAQAETDDGIDNPWPEVIEAMKVVLAAQNGGDARIDESARKAIKDAEQASKEFDADHAVEPDETTDIVKPKPVPEKVQIDKSAANKYGRNGKKEFLTHMNNAGIDPSSADGRDYVNFFETYYNAGLSGQKMPKVEMFPGIATSVFFAGQKDAGLENDAASAPTEKPAAKPEASAAPKHNIGDKVTVKGETGEATVTAVRGDKVVVEMDNVGITGTKTTTISSGDATPVSKGSTVQTLVAKSGELSDNGTEKENSFDHSKEDELKQRLLSKKKPKKIVDVVDDSDDALAAAVKRLSGELGKLSANPVFNPALMDAALEVGLIYTQRGVNNFGEWSAKMVKAVGEKIKPYLPSTWSMINNFPAGEKYDQETVNTLFEYAGIQYEKGATTMEALSKKITDELGEEFDPYVKMAYEGIASWKEAANSGREGTANNQLPEGKPSEKADGRSNSDNQEDSAAADENVGNNDGQAATAPAGPRGGLDAEVSAKPDGGKRSGKQPNVGKRKNDVRNRNYVITEKDHLGKGGAVQKYNDNIAAIKLIHQLNEENRQATPEEQAILVKYVGWGGFPQLFDHYLRSDNEWYGRSRELKELLSPEEYSAARASTTNAHYTSETVVRAIWDGVKRLGFDGGKVLEPSMGIGNFFGLIPKDLRDSKLTGIELDNLTGAIAKQLYPDANIQITGFEKSPIPDEYYDLAISNVPFGDYSLHDPKYNKYKLNIHNYFFVKALDKVRSGGLVVFVTGSGTMQSEKQSAVRAMIAERAELLAAVKMPNTAFKENARTEVTTDVLFLRKLMPDESPSGHAWQELAESGVKSAAWPYGDMKINEYFAKNPDMMLGELYEDKLHQGRLGLKDDGRDLGEIMKKALSKLPKNIYQQSAVKAPDVLDISQMIDAPGTVREGSVQSKGGKIFIAKSGKMIPQDMDAKKAAAVSAMVTIREHVRELMRSQLDPATTDAILTHRRAALKSAYDAYVKEHGYLGASKNKVLFADDPDSGLIFGLEDFSGKAKEPKLSDIFTTRTIQPFRRASDVSTPEEALIASLQETGRVKTGRIASLLNKSEDEVIRDLEGLIFMDPSTGKWETKDVYLSGNVRQKLVAAKEAVKTDKKYSLNVSELEKVQPADLQSHEIKAKLGSPWIPASDIENFVSHLLDSRKQLVKIKHDDLSNTWLVDELRMSSWERPDQTKNYRTWGTSRYSAIDLIDAILNHRSIAVKDEDDNGRRTITNAKETAAAQDKAEEIKKEFNKWVWSEQERAARLVREYNDNFNAVRLPRANGEHLQVPGLTTRISLRPHQKDAIWRIVQGGNNLIAHGVGLGKTLVMQAAGMKLRQLGLSRKPMYVIPNSTISDFETKFREHFPAAKILVISSKALPPETPVTKKVKQEKKIDGTTGRKMVVPEIVEVLDKEKTAERIQARRATLTRMATEDWDAILITHTQFKNLPMSPQSQTDFIQQTINDYAAAIEAARAESGSSRYVKELEAQKRRWETKLEAALSADTKSIVTPFEELGVDYLFVDEADVFKNLGFATAMGRIAGVQNGDSKRALDMFSKTSYLNKVNNGSGVVFATGTPISNTMGEMFTMMRYLIPQRLRELNIGHFDTWASNFGETIPSFERDVSGKGFRTVERFAKFVNAPELIKLFREFADVKRAEDVNLPLPKLRTGSWQTVVSPMSKELKDYIDNDITKRVEAIRNGSVKPDEDNMLVVTSDLRKAALDVRLVIPGAKLAPDSKIVKAVNNIYRIWKETEKKRSTQIVFCDLSVPKAEKANEVEIESNDDDFEVEAADASVYQTIQRMLVEKGIPKEEVVFIHDAKNSKQKQALFDKMNSGEIRVLIGSTGKAGVGLNVQNKLVAAHHLDVPWRPRDLEQRNGRIVRQGNENDEVDVFAYATEGSADSLMWERVALKQRFIQHAMSDNLTDREIEEDDMSLGFAEIAAITSGNPLLAEKVKLESQVTRLRLLREKHEGDKGTYKWQLANVIPAKIEAANEAISNIEKDISARKDVSGDKFSVSLLGETYTDRKEAEESLAKFIGENTFDVKVSDGRMPFVIPDSVNKTIGKIGGINLVTRRSGIGEQTYTITNKKDGSTIQALAGEIRLELEGPSGKLYNVITTSVSGVENRLRRMDDFLKEARADLEKLESSKAEIQRLIEKPFDREAEYQKLKGRLDQVVSELAETPEESDSDVTLNSGVDPFQLIPGLRKYSDMTVKEAFDDLVAIGRKVAEETSHGGRWMARMKELLGDVWTKAKKVIGKVWNEVRRTVKDNTGAISMSAREVKDAANFSKKIDQWEKGKLLSSELLILNSSTPTVYQELGAENIPLVIDQRTIKKVVTDKHTVTIDQLKQLPKQLVSPVMIFESATIPGSMVSLTEILDGNSKPIVVAIHLNKIKGRIIVNDIASAYGKDNAGKFVQNQVDNGRVKFFDKNKSIDWFQSRGLQLPKEGINQYSTQNVLYDYDVVKSSSLKRLDSGETPFDVLTDLGRSVFQEGYNTASKWISEMRSILGSRWSKFQNIMAKVWNEVKKTVSNNRGAIYLGGKKFESKAVTVSPGQEIPAELQKKGWSAEVLPDGSTRLVRPQPKPVEIPKAFKPEIDGMDRRVAFEFEQSKELPKVPTKEKLRENLEKAKAYMSRKYKALPNEARFAPLKFALTQLEHKKGVATDTTVRILDKITATLKSPKDYSIFCHKVVFDDIAADLAADKNYEMPFGLTRENFQENYDAVNAAVTPEIQQAIDARKEAWQDFKSDYVQAMKDIGFSVEDRLKKGDTYFHHIVLDYVELKNRLDPVLGSKLRTPNYRGFLKTREGSTKNIMTDYLHPELEVMGQMMYDIEIAKTIKLVEKKYDISKNLRDAAKVKNFENLVGGPENVARIAELEGDLRELVDAGDKEGAAETRKELNELDPTRPFKQKIAMGFSKLDKMGIDPEDFAEITKLAKEEGETGMAAATILKAISEREKFMQEALGENYLQWRNGVDHRIIPEGYEAWQPREGNLFFTGFTIPEHVAQAIADNAMQEMGVSADQVRRVLAQGGRRREMIVPVEVSQTLHDISPAKALQHWALRGLTRIQGYWKQAVLTMPTRFASYNLNNIFGDLDAVIAAQGAKGLNFAGRAAKELYGVFYKGKEMSPEMQSWFERGGFESLLQTQEAGKVNQLKIFDRFIEKDSPIKNFPSKLWHGYWSAARKATDFRESILRYAKFLDYREQMQKNDGRPKEFGASDPASVMALDDIDDRAFKLSNELLGAYDSISEFGQDMRSFIWPFWSWKEVNATRYVQMIKNATIDDRTAANVAAKVGGLALRKAPFAAIKAGTFLIKAGFLFALINAYNWWVWPEEEKDLEDSVKYRMHLILGRDNDGKVRYIRTSGAFADLLGWVGWDTPMQHYDAWLSGRKSPQEIAIDSAVAPFNQIASGVTPYLKIPAEAAYGKTLYPDVRKPRPIHDRGEYLARSFALGEEYRAVFGLPHRPYDGAGFLPVKKSDPMQAAYYSITNAKQEWLKDHGKYNEGGFSNPKSEALRYYKEALRYQDEAAAVKYLEQYKLAGGTKEGLERSLEATNPLSGMKKADRQAFVASLSPYEREKLDLAQAYFDMVLQRSGGQLKQTQKGNIDVKVDVDLPSEKKPKKQGSKFYF